MGDFIIVLLICSVTMSALSLFYMAVTPFLAERYSSKGQYYAWLIIVIGFIIPFRPQFDYSFVRITPTDTIIPAIQAGNGTPLVNPMAFHLSPAASVMYELEWGQITAAVWLIGFIAFLIYHIVKHYRFMKMTSHWCEVVEDEETLRLFQSIKTELGISKEINLYYCISVGTPMLTGPIHPKILLPEIIFKKDELRFILIHELIHYKRKDLWYKCLVLFASAIHWFNPLMYFFARKIDEVCEISCDSEVVNHTNADTRLQYSEAILGVVKYQSNMKTTLSTNFNGGKKGMKKRIFSIMDTRSKKSGITILSGILIFTLGTGFVFAAKGETYDRPEYIKEDIVISPDSYKFLPDPAIYGKYSSYGIAVSDDGNKLLYNGQKIRLFVDEYSDAWAFYYDDAGTVNLSVTRNSSGEITDLKTISGEAAQKYRSAFFADDLNSEVHTSGNKYEQYSPYGINFIEEENILYFNGQRVRLFVDESDGFFDTFWVDEAGTVNLSVMRNSSGQMLQIETISKEKAQDYIAAADHYVPVKQLE